MQEYISELQVIFLENTDSICALQQTQYMKNNFEFYGISASIRKQLQKPFLQKDYLPNKKEAFKIVKELWQKPQRELQYFSQELVAKYNKQLQVEDIILIEWMITYKSWWDTVDFIASNIVGAYFKKFPNQKEEILNKWLVSDNIWLQRTCLIFQLRYKQETDSIFLENAIQYLKASQEFFIKKAIGWALRQYAKTNPTWVVSFVENTPTLSKLSQKEALRLLK